MSWLLWGTDEEDADEEKWSDIPKFIKVAVIEQACNQPLVAAN